MHNICFYENYYYFLDHFFYFFLDEANFGSFYTDLQSTNQLDSENEIKFLQEEQGEFGKNSLD